MLLANLITTAALGIHTPYSRINGSQPYYLISPGTSRSPNEYLEWSAWRSDCYRGDDYSVGRCVQSHVLSSGVPPTSAMWFIFPEPECNDGLSSTPCYYHIFGSKDSRQPAMLLNFAWNGDIYPYPFYREDENWLANEMVWARFRIEAVSHASEQPNADELYHIINGPDSGKADEMIFLNRMGGDWLDTWTLDTNDHQATWRIVPAACTDAASCELPDLEAAWQEYQSRWPWWVGVLIGMGIWCCCTVCCAWIRGSDEACPTLCCSESPSVIRTRAVPRRMVRQASSNLSRAVPGRFVRMASSSRRSSSQTPVATVTGVALNVAEM